MNTPLTCEPLSWASNPWAAAFRLAHLSDLDEMKAVAGDFLNDYEVRLSRGELYVPRDRELVGLGLLGTNRFRTDCASPGARWRVPGLL